MGAVWMYDEKTGAMLHSGYTEKDIPELVRIAGNLEDVQFKVCIAEEQYDDDGNEMPAIIHHSTNTNEGVLTRDDMVNIRVALKLQMDTIDHRIIHNLNDRPQSEHNYDVKQLHSLQMTYEKLTGDHMSREFVVKPF